MSNIQEIFNILSSLSVIIGIPIALFQYFRTSRQERRDERQRQHSEREKLYDALDQRFVEYQKLCLQYPYLDVADWPQRNPIALDELQQHQEGIMIVILFTLFESAFLLLFIEAETSVRQKLWPSWDRYIRLYLARPNFNAAWKNGLPTGTDGIDHTFHEDFEKYMNQVIDDLEKMKFSASLPDRMDRLTAVSLKNDEPGQTED